MDTEAADAAQARLLALARAGDAQAFGALVAAHQSRVRQQLRRLCQGDAARADDLAQDCFLQAWQALPGFRGDARLSTWLHRIAYRCFLMDRRRQPADGAVDLSSDAEMLAACIDPRPGPALGIDLDRAVAALPEPQRWALVHCHHLELSHEEAAEVLGWPLGTLKSHLARGKAALRLALAAWQTGVTP
jgi:RNA polymerase sigma-70 factor (ECF subfamily)